MGLKLRNMFLLILYLDAMLTLMEQRHSRQHEIIVPSLDMPRDPQGAFRRYSDDVSRLLCENRRTRPEYVDFMWEFLPTCQIILKVAIHGKLRLKLRNMFLLILYLDAMLTLI